MLRRFLPIVCVIAVFELVAGMAAMAQPAKGTYSGLFAETNGPLQTSCGSISITASGKATFTGKILMGGSRASFKGTFAADGSARAIAKGGELPPLNLNLQSETAPNTDRLVGTISDGTWTSEVRAERAYASAPGSVAPQSGLYTVVLASTSAGPQQPVGSGFGTVSVSKSGRAKLAATLADGTKISQSSAVSTTGEWPLFVSPYKGKGLLTGWLSITNTSSQAISGTTAWIKAPDSNNTKPYSSGFSNQTVVAGSAFHAPAKGSAIVRFTSGDLSLQGGDLAFPVHGQITVASNNRVTSSGSPTIKMSFSTSSGLFRGTMSGSTLPKPVSFLGVVLQDADEGTGSFKGTHEYGSVWLLPAERETPRTETVNFQTLGSTFTADVRLNSMPEIFRWDWSDGTSSASYPFATHTFESAQPGVQSLNIFPTGLIDSIDLGFDGSDGGENTPLAQLPPANVGSVEFPTPLSSLRYWASSYTPITNTLDFTGFDSLERIECFHCSNLTHAVVANLPSVKRVCFEACPLEQLDLSSDPNLEDVRAAVSAYTNIIVGGGTGPKVWHFCVRQNPQLTQNLTDIITNFYSLQEFWIWNDNQSGALTTVSTNLTDVEFFANSYEFADFNYQPNLQIVLGAGNSLTNVDLSGCPALQYLDLSDNQLTTQGLDNILQTLDSPEMSSLTTVYLNNNPQFPSPAGYSHYTNLVNSGVSIYVDQP